jgi:hypothetical protein
MELEGGRRAREDFHGLAVLPGAGASSGSMDGPSPASPTTISNKPFDERFAAISVRPLRYQ